MRWTLLPFIIAALALAAYGSGQTSIMPIEQNESIQMASSLEGGDEVGHQSFTLSLSLYIVRQGTPDPSSGDPQPGEPSSMRTEDELTALAVRIQDIWQGAGTIFEPVVIHTIELPADVAVSLRNLDARPFFQAAGQEFEVPDTGQVNGFYLADLGQVNGFAPSSSNVFFVTDNPSVLDERVSSHEIGHILGLGHALDDPNRLMFSGTNGMNLTTTEVDIARTAAQTLGGSVNSVPSGEAPTSGTVRIDNQGGSREGHTPQGFAGSGIGLFVGDNLNPGFPDGDGVQVFLTFDLPADLNQTSQVWLTSDALQVSGTPFKDLGPLLVEPVTYDNFGPHLFDLDADGAASECIRAGAKMIPCDVTGSVSEAIARSEVSAQFRLNFTRPGDSDQSQDLAKFFRTDSNSNEPGLFTLEIQQ